MMNEDRGARASEPGVRNLVVSELGPYHIALEACWVRVIANAPQGIAAATAGDATRTVDLFARLGLCAADAQERWLLELVDESRAELGACRVLLGAVHLVALDAAVQPLPSFLSGLRERAGIVALVRHAERLIFALDPWTGLCAPSAHAEVDHER